MSDFIEPVHMWVAGNIGVGKTTFCRTLKEYLSYKIPDRNVKFFRERVPEARLKAFYEDLENGLKYSKHSGPSQTSIAITSLDDSFEIQSSSSLIGIQERFITEHKEFAFSQNVMGFMNDEEYATYQNLRLALTQDIKDPNLLIYLRTDMDSLLKRIEKRGIGKENVLLQRKDYLQKLEEQEKEIFERFKGRKIAIDFDDNYDVDRPWHQASNCADVKRLKSELNSVLTEIIPEYK